MCMSGVCLYIFFHFNNSNLNDFGPVQVMLFMTRQEIDAEAHGTFIHFGR